MKKPALLIALGGMKSREEDEDEEEAPPSSRGGAEMEQKALARELLNAISSRNEEKVAEAFMAFAYHCFEEFEEEPHHEGPHY